jgi:protein-tyrosine phosphatase
MTPTGTVAVCFVCLGNICRSPTAEGIFRKMVRAAGLGLEDRVTVESRGTGDWHTGEPADQRARAAAGRRGVTLDGVACRFDRRDFARFDYILSMDTRVLGELRRLARTDDERDPTTRPRRPTRRCPTRTTAATTASTRCSTSARPPAAAS